MKRMRKKYHVLVSAYNTLPVYISKPALIVVNQDPDFMPGSHWMAVYFDKYNFAYFFDSFGRRPSGNILRFIRKNSSMFSYNSKQIQSITSTVCGQYCLLFLLNYVMGNTVDDFLNMFSSQYENNDLLCSNLFYSIFSKL